VNVEEQEEEKMFEKQLEIENGINFAVEFSRSVIWYFIFFSLTT
jgi:hypothetical protein